MMKKQLSFLLAAVLLCGTTAGAAVLNEWIFDSDAAGLTLSQATNRGTDLAVFSADTTPVTQTDGQRSLICSNAIAGVGNLWTDGAVLRADVTNQSSGVRFLRYDLTYDMTATNLNDSGTLIGLAFADTTSTNLAGVGLLYDSINGATTPPVGITETVLQSGLALTGSLAVIAKVDLTAKTMEVWYNLSGANTFNASPDATVSNLNLTTIAELEFRATGDFIASSSSQCVLVDNIRTASTWTEITNATLNLLASPNLVVSISDTQGGAMAVGQTNVVSVTISNTGGPATDVFASLSHNGGAAFSFISSNNVPAPLYAGDSMVQTFSLVANSNGAYVLTAQASSAQNTGAPGTFNLLVGRQISYSSYSITNESGGIVAGQVEPGETFDLILTSINDGGATVTGITNSLSPVNAAYFTPIFPITTNIYASLSPGQTTSTTYRVTSSATTPGGLQPFTVINSTATGAWTNQFNLNVRREAIPQVSTNALTITVAPGEKGTASLSLSNIGSASGTYVLDDIGNQWGGFYYTVSTQTISMVGFDPVFDVVDPSTTFTNWGANATATMPIGFSFPLMGTPYANFFVSKYGAVSFSAAVGANTSAALPSGTAALAAPFWGSTAIDTNSIRYSTTKVPNALVVAWGNRTGAEFQAWLYQDGRIRYLYDQGSWSGGAIGVQQSDTLYQNVAYQPGSSGESIVLTPAKWVTHAPSSGTLASGGSQDIIYTVDATGQSTGTTVLTNTVAMGSSSETIIVTVIVEAAASSLTVTPSPINFTGSAGTLASTSMTVSNSGNTTLNYRISDTTAKANGYAWTNTPFNWDASTWDAIAYDAVPLLNDGDGKTDWIPFGFDFSFYGDVYTQFKIDANGGVLLNSPSAVTGGYDRVISVFGPVVSLDGNSTLRYSGNGNEMVVTWENMYQGDEGRDQTFQLLMYKDGRIVCQYQSVQGTNLWPEAGIYVDYDFNTAGLETIASLVNTGDGGTVAYTTNYVVTTNGYIYDTPVVVTNPATVTTNYVPTVREKAILFFPSQRVVISASPAYGTLVPKAAVPVTIYGDARSLPVGGSNYSVVNTTSLDVTSEASINNVPVTFTATNSASSSYTALAADPAVKASMWGTDDPFVSSVLNSDGSRTLSWPAAEDPLSRKYTIWYTTNLASGWMFLDAVDNLTTYTDRQHNTEPVIFYKVTVE